MRLSGSVEVWQRSDAVHASPIGPARKDAPAHVGQSAVRIRFLPPVIQVTFLQRKVC